MPFSAASFLINSLPTFVLYFISTWEKINSISPTLSALKTFGCAYYPYLSPYNRHKLQPRSVECVFLGYHPLSKGYMCLDPTTNKVYTTCYALFNENVFPFAVNLNLTHAHISFSSDVSDAQWLSIDTTSPDSHSTSSFPSSTSTSVD